jgi:hypothetical protein
MIPVHIKDTAFQKPDDPAYVLVAANGTFLVKTMDLYSATTLLDASALGIQDHRESVALHVGLIPHKLLCRVLGFFRAAYLWHGGEAIVLVYYSIKTRSFSINAPPQRVVCRRTGWGLTADSFVEYDTCERPADFLKLGSIHSHGDGSAFHSCQDERDEKHDDGLHITFGHLLRKQPDLSVSFVVNGRRFMLHPREVFEDPDKLEPLPPPASWVKQVTCLIPHHGQLEARSMSNGTPSHHPPVSEA